MKGYDEQLEFYIEGNVSHGPDWAPRSCPYCFSLSFPINWCTELQVKCLLQPTSSVRISTSGRHWADCELSQCSWAVYCPESPRLDLNSPRVVKVAGTAGSTSRGPCWPDPLVLTHTMEACSLTPRLDAVTKVLPFVEKAGHRWCSYFLLVRKLTYFYTWKASGSREQFSQVEDGEGRHTWLKMFKFRRESKFGNL